MSGKKVRIFSVQRGQYVGIDDKGRLKAHYPANACEILFEKIDNDDGSFSLKSCKNNLFVVVEEAGGLVAWDEGEKTPGAFRIEKNPTGATALYVDDGDRKKYVMIGAKDVDFRADATAPEPREWERLRVEPVEKLDILTHEERMELQNAQKTVDEIRGMSFGVVPEKVKESIFKQLEELQIAFQAFDANLFIVVCAGILKAGKSTLVNLLAQNRLASPMGYGYDTTLRPALVVRSPDDKGRIDIWFDSSASAGTVDNKEKFQKILLCERGVIDESKVLGLNRVKHPLAKEILRIALCEKPQKEGQNNILTDEPALVVVRLPRESAEDSLLDMNVAVLDTPGLDSGESKWTEDGRYHWILEQADLLLFIQSSVSALNRASLEVLADQIKSSATPIWLVHNRMDAKYWRKEEDRRLTNDDQRDKTSKVFAGLGIVHHGFSVNLGKAVDAKLDDKPNAIVVSKNLLCQESNYDALNDRLSQDLGSGSRSKMRRAHCVKDVRSCVDSMSEIIVDAKESLKNECQGVEKKGAQLKELVEEIITKAKSSGEKFTAFKSEDFVQTTQCPLSAEVAGDKLRSAARTLKGSEFTKRGLKAAIEKEWTNFEDWIKEMIRRVDCNHFDIQVNDATKSLKKVLSENFSRFIDSCIKGVPDIPELSMILEQSRRVATPALSIAEKVEVQAHAPLIDVDLGSKWKLGNLPLVKLGTKDLRNNVDLFFNASPADVNGFMKSFENVGRDVLEKVCEWACRTAPQAMCDEYCDALRKELEIVLKRKDDEIQKTGAGVSKLDELHVKMQDLDKVVRRLEGREISK